MNLYAICSIAITFASHDLYPLREVFDEDSKSYHDDQQIPLQ